MSPVRTLSCRNGPGTLWVAWREAPGEGSQPQRGFVIVAQSVHGQPPTWSAGPMFLSALSTSLSSAGASEGVGVAVFREEGVPVASVGLDDGVVAEVAAGVADVDL